MAARIAPICLFAGRIVDSGCETEFGTVQNKARETVIIATAKEGDFEEKPGRFNEKSAHRRGMLTTNPPFVH
ncbi:MAG: hypothetical protein GY820_31315 [Gammaproteobacteria bacterium]|nr:hypothetical protein [Gammaproteobacteria bacterium]